MRLRWRCTLDSHGSRVGPGQARPPARAVLQGPLREQDGEAAAALLHGRGTTSPPLVPHVTASRTEATVD